MWATVSFIAAAYLLGSVPFGLLIGLARGMDIRRHGSGNIGATNVGRLLGRPWGHLCLVLDIVKGLLPTLLAGRMLVGPQPAAGDLVAWLAVGLAAVLGHTFPVYLGFRGGKGVATTIGVALGIYPYLTIPMIAALLAYALVRFSTGFVSAGSLALAAVFPLAVLVYVLVDPAREMAEFWPLQAASVLLGLLIVVRHSGNIARMLRGQELGTASAGEAGDEFARPR
jgi:glycerol-3-phosphate acyltransferase PlsY